MWQNDYKNNIRRFPHEYFYKLILDGTLEKYYKINPKNSWMFAAAEKNLPMCVPGFEDSTTGDMFAASCIRGEINPSILKCGNRIYYKL